MIYGILYFFGKNDFWKISAAPKTKMQSDKTRERSAVFFKQKRDNDDDMMMILNKFWKNFEFKTNNQSSYHNT